MLLLTLIVFSVILVSFKEKTLILDEVELREFADNSTGLFAIMVEDDDGSYVEYTEDTFPTGMAFNSSMSSCINNNGETLTDVVTFSNGTVTVYAGETMFCYLYFDIGGTLADTILLAENDSETVEDAISYIESKGEPDFSTAATTDEGLYAAEDDYGTSYYFRGAVEDNYVYFAGFYWRIVRINGDGSVRLIYDGTEAHVNGESNDDRYIGKSYFNEYYDENKYVGYMYGDSTYEESITSTTKTLQSYYYYYGTSYEFDKTTGTYTLSGTVSQYLWNSGLVGYYTCRSSSSTSCTTLYYIYSYYNNYQAKTYSYSRSGSSGSYTESHSTNLNTWDMAGRYYYGTSYYFDDTTGYYVLSDYAYNIYNGDSSLVGYYTCGVTYKCRTMYYIESVESVTTASVKEYNIQITSSYSEEHANKYSSTVKELIDEWYYANILTKTDGTTSYANYLSDALFCNDRSYTSGTATGLSDTRYSAYTRIDKYQTDNPSPILICTNKNDRFTVDDTINGNGALTYPVALLTADEAVLAGDISSYNNTYSYLYSGELQLSMSPVAFDTDMNGYAWWFFGYHGLSAYEYYYRGAVRPVINLSSSVTVTSGDGSINSPYEVSL